MDYSLRDCELSDECEPLFPRPMLPHTPIWALQENLSDEGGAIEHHGEAEGRGILVKLAVDPERCVQEDRVLWFRDVLHTAGKKENHLFTQCTHTVKEMCTVGARG